MGLPVTIFFPSCPFAGPCWEESSSVVFAHPHSVFKPCGKVSPKPALPQAKQPQLSQPLIICQMLQALIVLMVHLGGPSPVYPWPSCTGMLSTGASTPDVLTVHLSSQCFISLPVRMCLRHLSKLTWIRAPVYEFGWQRSGETVLLELW